MRLVVLDVRLFGSLSLTVDGEIIPLTGRLPRALVAALAMSAGRPLPTQTLVEQIWGDSDHLTDPRGRVHSVVRRVRAQVRKDLIHSGAGGYCLAVDPDGVDALRFLSLVEESEQVSGDAEHKLLVEALGLWRGEPFNEPLSDWLNGPAAHRLTERYLTALERRVQLDLADGQHAPLVAELRDVVARHPFRETLWAHLLTALVRSGRRAEALAAYEELRRKLADELGVAPGAELQTIFVRLLRDPQAIAAPVAGTSVGPIVPRQLPGDLEGFSGRDDHLAELDQLLADRGPGVIAIHGAGGVGKSTLAIHWARRIADDYPDGQLFVSLRGYGPSDPTDPREAVEVMLTGLGVSPADVPTGLEACSSLLRSVLADRRVLIILDDARDAEQVRPLLPGGANLVVVTGRSQLRGLAVRDGARRVGIDTWSLSESVRFLRDRLRTDAIAESELTELSELAELCGRLPLALAVAVERTERDGCLSLADLIGELRDEKSRLDALEAVHDPLSDVRAVLSWSYGVLDDRSARLFRLLGLHPAGDLSADAVAALAGVSLGEVRRLLDRLADAHLVRVVAADRYQMHDLLHAYAAERGRLDDQTERLQAFRRLASFYSHSAMYATDAAVNRVVWYSGTEPLEPVVTPRTFESRRDARHWFATQWPTMRAVIRNAFDHGQHEFVIRLIIKTNALRRPGEESVALEELARGSARALDDRTLEGFAANRQAVTFSQLGRFADARAKFCEALELFLADRHDVGHAMVLGNLGKLAVVTGHPGEAIGLFEPALDLWRRKGEPYHEAMTLENVARAYQQLGRLADARSAVLRCLELNRGVGQPVEEAIALLTLGSIDAELSDPSGAERSIRRALGLFDEQDDRWYQAVALHRLGNLGRDTGRNELARSCWLESLSIIDEFGVDDQALLSRDELVELLSPH